jgi:hypothetical protein
MPEREREIKRERLLSRVRATSSPVRERERQRQRE